MERLYVSQKQYLALNNNTHVLAGGIGSSPENIIRSAPTKIKRRVAINLAGLNGLSTTVIPPQEIQEFGESDLKNIIDLSSQSNSYIGLPGSNDLIIRTSAEPFFSFNKRKINGMSEPALLVRNVFENPEYKFFGTDNATKKLSSLDEFIELIPKNVFLIIHDDNYELQINGVHGAIYEKNGSAELYLRTGSLQARNMGDPNLNYPTVRINANYFEDLFISHPSEVAEAASTQKEYSTSRYKIRTLNCDPSQAIELIKTCRIDNELISFSQERVHQLFGEGYSTEFRIYPNLSGWLGERLHVLDVD